MAPSLDPTIRTVYNMITRYGGDSTLVVLTQGEYDPTQGEAVTQETLHTVRTLAFDYIQKADGVGTKFGTLIQDGDKQLFMLPKAGVPAPRPQVDKITYEGVRHSVVALKALNPSGNKVIMYEMYIRK